MFIYNSTTNTPLEQVGGLSDCQQFWSFSIVCVPLSWGVELWGMTGVCTCAGSARWCWLYSSCHLNRYFTPEAATPAKLLGADKYVLFETYYPINIYLSACFSTPASLRFLICHDFHKLFSVIPFANSPSSTMMPTLTSNCHVQRQSLCEDNRRADPYLKVLGLVLSSAMKT